MKGDAMTLPTVFISYSHKDENWKDLLRPKYPHPNDQRAMQPCCLSLLA